MPQIAKELKSYALSLGYILQAPYLTVDKNNHVCLTHPETGLTAPLSCGNTQDSNQHKWKDYKQVLRNCAEPDESKRRFRNGKGRQAGEVIADHKESAVATPTRLTAREKKAKNRENKANKYK